MGPSTILNAPKCGSGAHRPTHLWQNLLPKEELDEAYSNLIDPPHTHGQRHAKLRWAWLMANAPRRYHKLHHRSPHQTTPLWNKNHSSPPDGTGPVTNDMFPLERRNPPVALPRSEGDLHGLHRWRHRGHGSLIHSNNASTSLDNAQMSICYTGQSPMPSPLLGKSRPLDRGNTQADNGRTPIRSLNLSPISRRHTPSPKVTH